MPELAPCGDHLQEGRAPLFATSRGAVWLAVACLVGAILAAYHNSFSGPFVFDDGPAVLGNPTIRHLSALGSVLSPPREGGQTVGGRPVVNLSLAVNYALGGAGVRGYHVFNLIVHLLGALTLFGIAWRTLLQPALRERYGYSATPLALAVALLWAVHPLLTESVTYVIQRAESLMGLCYLLTLYCFIRGAVGTGRRGNVWLLLAVGVCALGMATKEVMVSAPLLVLLYDRTFVAGSWRGAWAKRRLFYLSLGATWLLLGWLVLGTEHRGGTAGLGMGDSAWTYALTQTRAIARYLQLVLWPHPLVFDYGTDEIERLADALPFALVVALPLAGTAVALWRWPVSGFSRGMVFRDPGAEFEHRADSRTTGGRTPDVSAAGGGRRAGGRGPLFALAAGLLVRFRRPGAGFRGTHREAERGLPQPPFDLGRHRGEVSGQRPGPLLFGRCAGRQRPVRRGALPL